MTRLINSALTFIVYPRALRLLEIFDARLCAFANDTAEDES